MRGVILAVLAGLLGLACAREGDRGGGMPVKGRPRGGVEKGGERAAPRPVGAGKSTIWDTLTTGAIYAQFHKIIALDEQLTARLQDPSARLTLFCPTNIAVTNRGRIADVARLLNIANYHVVEGVVAMEDVRRERIKELPTLLVNDHSPYTNLPSDQAQIIAIRDGGLFSGNLPVARYTGVRRDCSNGVIYIIDVMLIPPEPTPDGLVETPFASMLPLLHDPISNNRGLTMFVPTRRAYAAAIRRTAELKIVKRHVVVGVPKYLGDLTPGLTLRAMDGVHLQVSMSNGELAINGRRIIKGNIPTSFGVVHLIDSGINALSRDELMKHATRSGKRDGGEGGEEEGQEEGREGEEEEEQEEQEEQEESDLLQSTRLAKDGQKTANNKRAHSGEKGKARARKPTASTEDPEDGDGNAATSLFSRSSLLSFAVGGLLLAIL